MAQLSLPHTLTAGAPENINDVQDNFVEITDFINNALIGVDNLEAALQALLVPTGTIVASGRTTAPTGWLLCEGALISKTTYAALFTAIGHFFNDNVDPGGGNFKLPDFRGRVLTGVDGTAGRITTFYGLGQTGGSETHTLTVAQMPSHAHVQRWAASPASGASATPSWGGDLDTDTVSSPFSTDPTGGGGSHNNLQPYQNVRWIIKI